MFRCEPTQRRYAALNLYFLFAVDSRRHGLGPSVDVRGTVLNDACQPVEFATVVLLGPQDSSAVQAAVADARDAFMLRGVASLPAAGVVCGLADDPAYPHHPAA